MEYRILVPHIRAGKLQATKALIQSAQAVAHVVLHRKPRGNHSRREGQSGCWAHGPKGSSGLATLRRMVYGATGGTRTGGLLRGHKCRNSGQKKQWSSMEGGEKTWGSVGQTRHVRSTSLGQPNAVFRRPAIGRHSNGMGKIGGLSCLVCG
jgi:hypothetical protein